jgi:hypothetical protein
MTRPVAGAGFSRKPEGKVTERRSGNILGKKDKDGIRCGDSPFQCNRRKNVSRYDVMAARVPPGRALFRGPIPPGIEGVSPSAMIYGAASSGGAVRGKKQCPISLRCAELYAIFAMLENSAGLSDQICY